MAVRRRERLSPPEPDHSQEPRDYYFFVQSARSLNQFGDANATEVYFTSASYFDREGAQSDWHVSDYIGDILEDFGLEEVTEGCCVVHSVTHLGSQLVRQSLLERGFRENLSFNEVVLRGAMAGQQPPADPPYMSGRGGRSRSQVDDWTPADILVPEDRVPLRSRSRFDQLNEESPPPPRNEPPPHKATAYDKLLEDEVVPGEQPVIPATTVEIVVMANDPRKVTIFCDNCGQEAVYSFKAAKRILGCCESSGCMKPLLPKLEQWAQEAQSKSWDLISDDDLLEPEKPKLSAKEEILGFQKSQGIPETGELNAQTETALRRAGREGMIPVWRDRLQKDDQVSV